MKKFAIYIVFIFIFSSSQAIPAVDSLVYTKAINSVGLITDESTSIASGFFINKNIFVTNWHVTEMLDLPTANITMKDGTVHGIGKVLLENTNCDIAVIEIKGSNTNFLTIADPLTIKSNDRVYSLGNPTNSSLEIFKYKMTKGRIRSIKEEDWFYDDDSHHLAYVIRHTATIRPGNSGGPLLNERGDVIGVNTFFYSYSKNYAVHIEELMSVLDSYQISYTCINPDGSQSTRYAKKVSDIVENSDTGLFGNEVFVFLFIGLVYFGTSVLVISGVTLFVFIGRKRNKVDNLY